MFLDKIYLKSLMVVLFDFKFFDKIKNKGIIIISLGNKSQFEQF